MGKFEEGEVRKEKTDALESWGRPGRAQRLDLAIRRKNPQLSPRAYDDEVAERMNE